MNEERITIENIFVIRLTNALACTTYSMWIIFRCFSTLSLKSRIRIGSQTGLQSEIFKDQCQCTIIQLAAVQSSIVFFFKER